ncbi:acyl-CoA N-acyltransferase [Butyriboletus roseoflavus]|nr:acyl-CoA N-acyltransferase [Butyriboletus roseoflavus]
MSSIQFHVRPATVDDVDALLQLVRDLATYEKEPESAKATRELFRENIFDKGYAHALLALQGTPAEPGAPLGMALYFFNFSTWTGRPGLYLEDLFVKPEARNMGIGKALFAELAKVAQAKVVSCDLPPYSGPLNSLFFSLTELRTSRLVRTHRRCTCLVTTLGNSFRHTQWNEPSIAFYEKVLSAKRMDGWMGMRLTDEGIQNLTKYALVAN